MNAFKYYDPYNFVHFILSSDATESYVLEKHKTSIFKTDLPLAYRNEWECVDKIHRTEDRDTQ
jgi:hypothetical protein